MLKKFCQENTSHWHTFIPFLLFAYRETKHPSTGFSPFELLYGRKPRGVLDVLRESWEPNTSMDSQHCPDTTDYIIHMRERLHAYAQMSQQSQEKAQEIMKTYQDRKRKPRSLSPDDLVLILLPCGSNKLEMRWKGPYKVLRKVSDHNYEIQVDGQRKRSTVYNINLLRKFHPKTEEKSQQHATNTFHACLATADDDCSEPFTTRKVVTYEVNPAPSFDPATLDIYPGWSKSQKQNLVELILEFKDVISENPGRSSLIKHSIHTGDHPPIRQHPYRLPQATRNLVKDELDRMLAAGVIKPSTSEWSSPTILVPKKDGSVRFCIDYRKLNAISRYDAYPMPRTDELIEFMASGNVLSSLDCPFAYWSVELDEESKCKTAFITPEGLFQCEVMPFGLATAPMTFQRGMDEMYRGCQDFVRAYLDDSGIKSSDFDFHLDHLRQVFTRLRQSHLTINPRKCKFAYPKLEYLGHLVGCGEIQPTQDKTEAIMRIPAPATQKQVRSFLGLVQYYAKFIPHYSEIAKPLFDLTHKTIKDPIPWGSKEEEAFKTLKKRLSSDPVLRAPRFDLPFILYCDASDIGLGCVVEQTFPDGDHPIFYLSKKLLPCETRYSTIERECYAIFWATRKMHYYLSGRKFTVITDHNPLKWLHTMRDTNRRVNRWALELQEYHFEIKTRPGRLHVNADTLSRL